MLSSCLMSKKEEKDKMIKEAEANVDKLLWKQDIWFGKAIVMKAHLLLMRGDLTGTRIWSRSHAATQDHP